MATTIQGEDVSSDLLTTQPQTRPQPQEPEKEPISPPEVVDPELISPDVLDYAFQKKNLNATERVEASLNALSNNIGTFERRTLENPSAFLDQIQKEQRGINAFVGSHLASYFDAGVKEFASQSATSVEDSRKRLLNALNTGKSDGLSENEMTFLSDYGNALGKWQNSQEGLAENGSLITDQGSPAGAFQVIQNNGKLTASIELFGDPKDSKSGRKTANIDLDISRKELFDRRVKMGKDLEGQARSDRLDAKKLRDQATQMESDAKTSYAPAEDGVSMQVGVNHLRDQADQLERNADQKEAHARSLILDRKSANQEIINGILKDKVKNDPELLKHIPQGGGLTAKFLNTSGAGIWGGFQSAEEGVAGLLSYFSGGKIVDPKTVKDMISEHKDFQNALSQFGWASPQLNASWIEQFGVSMNQELPQEVGELLMGLGISGLVEKGLAHSTSRFFRKKAAESVAQRFGASVLGDVAASAEKKTAQELADSFAKRTGHKATQFIEAINTGGQEIAQTIDSFYQKSDELENKMKQLDELASNPEKLSAHNRASEAANLEAGTSFKKLTPDDIAAQKEALKKQFNEMNENAGVAFIGTVATSGGLEMIGWDKFFKRNQSAESLMELASRRMARESFKRSGKEVTEDVIAEAGKKLISESKAAVLQNAATLKFVDKMWSGLASGNSEALTEGLQTLTSNAFIKEFIDSNQAIFSGVPESAAAGFAIGAIFGVASARGNKHALLAAYADSKRDQQSARLAALDVASKSERMFTSSQVDGFEARPAAEVVKPSTVNPGKFTIVDPADSLGVLPKIEYDSEEEARTAAETRWRDAFQSNFANLDLVNKERTNDQEGPITKEEYDAHNDTKASALLAVSKLTESVANNSNVSTESVYMKLFHSLFSDPSISTQKTKESTASVPTSDQGASNDSPAMRSEAINSLIKDMESSPDSANGPHLSSLRNAKAAMDSGKNKSPSFADKALESLVSARSAAIASSQQKDEPYSAPTTQEGVTLSQKEVPSDAKITNLKPNQVFVFGANEAGRHGKGAALDAVKFGAEKGKFGRMGQSYGIPTKDSSVKTLPLQKIKEHINAFIEHAKANPETEFLLTPVGTGLAGYKASDIAPLFKNAPSNVVLPREFSSVGKTPADPSIAKIVESYQSLRWKQQPGLEGAVFGSIAGYARFNQHLANLLNGRKMASLTPEEKAAVNSQAYRQYLGEMLSGVFEEADPKSVIPGVREIPMKFDRDGDNFTKIRNGKRRATTRFDWGGGAAPAPGSIIFITNGKGKGAYALVTRATQLGEMKAIHGDKFVDVWSKKEGYSTESAKSLLSKFTDYTTQVEFIPVPVRYAEIRHATMEHDTRARLISSIGSPAHSGAFEMGGTPSTEPGSISLNLGGENYLTYKLPATSDAPGSGRREVFEAMRFLEKTLTASPELRPDLKFKFDPNYEGVGVQSASNIESTSKVKTVIYGPNTPSMAVAKEVLRGIYAKAAKQSPAYASAAAGESPNPNVALFYTIFGKLPAENASAGVTKKAAIGLTRQIEGGEFTIVRSKDELSEVKTPLAISYESGHPVLLNNKGEAGWRQIQDRFLTGTLDQQSGLLPTISMLHSAFTSSIQKSGNPIAGPGIGYTSSDFVNDMMMSPAELAAKYPYAPHALVIQKAMRLSLFGGSVPKNAGKQAQAAAVAYLAYDLNLEADRKASEQMKTRQAQVVSSNLADVVAKSENSIQDKVNELKLNLGKMSLRNLIRWAKVNGLGAKYPAESPSRGTPNRADSVKQRFIESISNRYIASLRAEAAAANAKTRERDTQMGISDNTGVIDTFVRKSDREEIPQGASPVSAGVQWVGDGVFTPEQYRDAARRDYASESASSPELEDYKSTGSFEFNSFDQLDSGMFESEDDSLAGNDGSDTESSLDGLSNDENDLARIEIINSAIADSGLEKEFSEKLGINDYEFTINKLLESGQATVDDINKIVAAISMKAIPDKSGADSRESIIKFLVGNLWYKDTIKPYLDLADKLLKKRPTNESSATRAKDSDVSSVMSEIAKINGALMNSSTGQADKIAKYLIGDGDFNLNDPEMSLSQEILVNSANKEFLGDVMTGIVMARSLIDEKPDKLAVALGKIFGRSSDAKSGSIWRAITQTLLPQNFMPPVEADTSNTINKNGEEEKDFTFEKKEIPASIIKPLSEDKQAQLLLDSDARDKYVKDVEGKYNEYFGLDSKAEKKVKAFAFGILKRAGLLGEDTKVTGEEVSFLQKLALQEIIARLNGTVPPGIGTDTLGTLIQSGKFAEVYDFVHLKTADPADSLDRLGVYIQHKLNTAPKSDMTVRLVHFRVPITGKDTGELGAGRSKDSGVTHHVKNDARQQIESPKSTNRVDTILFETKVNQAFDKKLARLEGIKTNYLSVQIESKNLGGDKVEEYNSVPTPYRKADKYTEIGQENINPQQLLASIDNKALNSSDLLVLSVFNNDKSDAENLETLRIANSLPDTERGRRAAWEMARGFFEKISSLATQKSQATSFTDDTDTASSGEMKYEISNFVASRSLESSIKETIDALGLQDVQSSLFETGKDGRVYPKGELIKELRSVPFSQMGGTSDKGKKPRTHFIGIAQKIAESSNIPAEMQKEFTGALSSKIYDSVNASANEYFLKKENIQRMRDARDKRSKIFTGWEVTNPKTGQRVTTKDALNPELYGINPEQEGGVELPMIPASKSTGVDEVVLGPFRYGMDSVSARNFNVGVERVRLPQNLRQPTLNGVGIFDIFEKSGFPKDASREEKMDAFTEMMKSFINENPSARADFEKTAFDLRAKVQDGVDFQIMHDQGQSPPTVSGNQEKTITPEEAVVRLINSDWKPSTAGVGVLFQANNQLAPDLTEKGRIIIDGANKVIQLMKGKADVSTVIHEIVHWFDTSTMEDGTTLLEAAMGDNYKGFMEWAVGSDEKGNPRYPNWRDQKHPDFVIVKERIARSVEQYLREGHFKNEAGIVPPKAQKGLRALCRTIANIYKGVRGAIMGVGIDDRVVKAWDDVFIGGVGARSIQYTNPQGSGIGGISRDRINKMAQYLGRPIANQALFEEMARNASAADYGLLESYARDQSVQNGDVLYAVEHVPTELGGGAPIRKAFDAIIDPFVPPPNTPEFNATTGSTNKFTSAIRHIRQSVKRYATTSAGALNDKGFLNRVFGRSREREIVLAGKNFRNSLTEQLARIGDKLVNDIEFAAGLRSVGMTAGRSRERQRIEGLLNTFFSNPDIMERQKAFFDLPTVELQDSAIAARIFLDDLSQSLIDYGIVDSAFAPMIATIRNSIGFYIHKTFPGLRDPNWESMVTVHPDYVKNINEIAAIKGVSFDQAAEIVKTTIREQKTKHDVINGKLSSTAAGALLPRQIDEDIRPQMEQLLGVEDRPEMMLVQTGSHLIQIMVDNMTQAAIRDYALAAGHIVHPDNSAANDPRNTMIGNPPEKEGAPRKPLSPETGATLADMAIHGPLAGYLTTPMLAEFYNNIFNEHSLDKVEAKWARGLLLFNLWSKKADTVFNPSKYGVNFMSSLLTYYATGHIGSGMMSGIGSYLSGTFTDDQSRDFLTGLNLYTDDFIALSRTGLFESATIQDLNYVTAGVQEAGKGIMKTPIASGTGRRLAVEVTKPASDALKKINKVASSLFSAGDVIPKLMAYHGERESLRSAFPTLNERELTELAARRTSQSMFTYDRNPLGVRLLSKVSPFGAWATYPFGITRALFQGMGIGISDIIDGYNRKSAGEAGGGIQMLMGVKRLAGIGMTTVGFQFLAKAICASLGWSDEKLQALYASNALPNWANRHPVIPLDKFGSTHQPRFVALGQLLPFTYATDYVTGGVELIKKMSNLVSLGESGDHEKMVNEFNEMLTNYITTIGDPLLSQSAAVRVAGQLIQNEDKKGNQLIIRGDSDSVYRVLSAVFGAQLIPGAIKTATKTGILESSAYTPAQIEEDQVSRMFRLFGCPVVTTDIGESFRRDAATWNRIQTSNQTNLNNFIKGGEYTPDQLRAQVERAISIRNSSFQAMRRTFLGAVDIGGDPGILGQNLREAYTLEGGAPSKIEAFQILNGFDSGPIEITSEAFKEAEKKFGSPQFRELQTLIQQGKVALGSPRQSKARLLNEIYNSRRE